MDTTELRRSALERKDRDSLTTIAKSLGAKPPAKARKAEIVDLILKAATTDAAEGDRADEGDSPKDGGGDSPKDGGSASAKDGGNSDSDAVPMTYHAGDDEEFDFGEVTTPGTRSQRPKKSGRGASDKNASDGETRGGQQRNRTDGAANDQGDRGNRRPRRRRGRERDNAETDKAWEGDPVAVDGYLDLRSDGYGFLRVNGWRSSREDAYVSVKQVRQGGLRMGDHLAGTSRPANRNEKNPAMITIESVNGDDPDKSNDRPRFEDLTPLFPDEPLWQEMPDDSGDMTARIIDLLSPIGKGQRGLIVSPPKAGKTTIIKSIARSIETNHPEVHLIVLLVDERPEEVTDMQRWLVRGEVAASTFDRPVEEHTAVAELTIERAKRMVEADKDVVIVLDGITRLARAYNLAAPATGRVMSGGVDAGALYPPKKFFGAARNVEEGGSLTILATALVDTGSRMDEVIFEEFKGTGNMELRLDRSSAERRIYPAIDVEASSTRHEELLYPDKKHLDRIWKLRRVLSGVGDESDTKSAAGLELLIERLKTFKTNAEFLDQI